jgi:6-phosphogluconolactonase
LLLLDPHGGEQKQKQVAVPLDADMPAPPDIRIAGDGQEWAYAVATLILAISEQAIESRGRFLIALSGGSTPKTLFQMVATPEWKDRFNWGRTVFLFGDERCIPPEHPNSNFRMAQDTLFTPLAIGSDQIYRMNGEDPNPILAAQKYEEQLRKLTGCAAPDIPPIDLVLLGLGEDGHTASLFPGTEALQERTKLVTIGHAPKGVRSRLTMTLGVINRATVVLFLVTGSSKAAMVRAILKPQSEADRRFPAAMVAPAAGRLIWMLDSAAAAQLTGSH